MSEEILAKGRFRVDRKRALEKMERFQLADPLAYTLELVAAAVAGGATRIEVENDSDDFVIRWDGSVPTRDELDGLFDALFGHAAGRRAGLLQHLAMGVLGALGQAPKWVHIDVAATADAPALRLAVKDPAETRTVEHAHDLGGATTRVHVRQRFSLANVAEALLAPIHGAPEARLLRDRARWCPVPLFLDGKPLAPPEPPAHALASRVAEGRGALWLLDHPGARVAIVRHGVVVGTLERTVGALRVFGWFPGHGLELDASRAEIVRDEAFDKLERALDDGVAGLLGAFAELAAPRLTALDEQAAAIATALTVPGAHVPAGHAAELRAWLRAAAAWLAARRRPLGAYLDLPLFVDATDRPWSVAALRAHTGKKGTVADVALAEPGTPMVLLPLSDAAALDLLVPGLPDLTAALRARAEGRERRRRAEADRLPPDFGASAHQRRFEDGPLRGAVRFDADGGAFHSTGSLRVSLRLGGVVVEEAHLASPAGGMLAIADHPGFGTDDAFKSVTSDAVRAAAEARVLAEAAAFAADHIARIARGAHLHPPAMAVLTAAVRAAGAKARTDLGALLVARPDDLLLRAPAFTCGDGRRLQLSDLLDGEWIVVDKLPRDCPAALAARVLVIPEDLAPAWLTWLGKRARDGRGTLAEEIRGAQRREGPKREAKLTIAGPTTSLDRGLRRGELGLEGDAREARVELLRDGIPVCTVALGLALPGVVGIIDDPGFAVGPAHDALTDPTAIPRLVKDLAPAVDALARAAWDAAPATPDRPLSAAVLAWITVRAASLPAWALDRPLAFDAHGTPITPDALRARNADKRVARYRLLSKPPRDVPGFEDAIVAGPDLRKALEAVGGRAVRDADPDLAGAYRALGLYMARSAAPAAPALAERVEETDGVRCRWVLPLDPDRVGVLRVEARWGGRVLSTWERGEALGLLGVLEGPAITPNAGLTMVRDPNVLTPWYRHARSRFDEVLREAIHARFTDASDPPPPLERATWRAILARLDGASDRHKSESALRDRLAALPLFSRLDGTVVSRDAIAAALDAGPVHTVATQTPEGAADSEWYLRDEPWATRALGVLASRIPDGGAALAAWREGEARRRALAPREARIVGETLVRAPIEARLPAVAGGEFGLTGEIGLVPGTDAHADGLVVHPLVDGRPLDPLRLPFPAPAVAVVTGPSVRPDRAFRAWEASAAAAAGPALLDAARALATTLVPATPANHAWLVRYALGALSGPGPGADLPVFPLLGGGGATARDLAARAALGGVGVVDPNTRSGPLVAGPPPVLAPLWMRERIAARFPVVDLAEVVERHRVRTPPSAPPHAVDVPEGRVAWSADTDAVAVVRGGVVVATVPAGGLVPLVGYVRSDTAEVDPAWKGLLPGGDTDALRARLYALARLVVERLVDEGTPIDGRVGPPRRGILIRALATTLSSFRDEAALRRAGADTLPGKLLAAPLFVDAAGAPGSFLDVLGRPNVRWVEPGVTGQALPDRGRVWCLSEAERALVTPLRPLVEATQALWAETRGMARRAATRCPPPVPAEGVTAIPLAAPFAGALWLEPTAGLGVAVRVDGSLVERIRGVVPGLAGWIEGAFPTDDAFATARLDPSANVALRGVAAELLLREVAAHPARVHSRLSEALAAVGHDHDALLGAPTSPWELVPLLVDTAGEPLDLRGLLRLRKSGKRILVGPAGAVAARRGERIVRGGAETLALLRAWFPGLPVEDIAEAQRRAEEKKREDAERKRAGAREKRAAAFVERAARLWKLWCGTPAPAAAVEAAVDAWAAGKKPGWPAILEADLDGPWAALVAFSVDAPADDTALTAGLARALADAEVETRG